MMKSTLRRILLTMPVLGMAVFAASSATAASGSNCTYYSDASKTTVVGQFGKDCCNNNVAWGTKTSYSTCSSACFICYPPPR